MSNPTIPERLDAIEDEVAGLESMIDARTRTLWQAIQKIQAEVEAYRADLVALREYIETGAPRQGE